jgi:hypothetical protein
VRATPKKDAKPAEGERVQAHTDSHLFRTLQFTQTPICGTIWVEWSGTTGLAGRAAMLRRITLSLICILMVSTGAAQARAWYVNPDGSADFETIHDGVNRALWGDSVIIACGVYFEAGLDLGPGVSLMSETGSPDCVEIDAAGEYYVITGWYYSDSTAAIAGLTLTGASRFALFLGSHSSGTFRDLVIEGNQNGMYLAGDASPILSDVRFIGNVGTGNGCGVFGDEGGNRLAMKNCRFLDNAGGAIWLTHVASVSLSDVEFIGNAAGIQLSEGWGDVTRCTFRDNGLAVGLQSCYCGPLRFDGCVFEGNGLGIYLMGGTPTITNSVFFGTTGATGSGAIYIDPGSPTVRGCTFALNSGPRGSAFDIVETDPYAGPCIIENTVIAYGIGAPAFYCWPSHDCEVRLECCDIYGNEGGDWVGFIEDDLGVNGNFSVCPSFCDMGSGNLGLCNGSPCAPGNHPDGYDCGLVGAREVGCVCGPSRSHPTAWGSIKALYR